MRDIETTARDACASAEARAAKAASRLAAAREAWSLMRRRAEDAWSRAEDLGARAQDFASRAPQQAREELARRRSGAATRLESLAEAIRPAEEARARNVRRAAGIVGGSTLVLAVALGAGVAIGMLISKRSKQKREAQVAAALEPGVAGPPTPAPGRPDAFGEVGGLPH